MNQLSRAQTVLSWFLQLAVAGILLQTLFFKFTGAEESVYIFSTVGRFLNIAGAEPWGRIGSGVTAFIGSAIVLALRGAQIPVVGRFVELA
jgi:putative oxidoreductase